MTSRERLLAALELKPLDRLPFWPKLDGSYPNYRRPRDRGKTVDDFFRFIGSDRQFMVGTGLKTVHRQTSREESREGNVKTTVWKTSSRELIERNQFDPGSNSWHPIEFPVKDLEDLRALTGYFQDLDVEVDTEALEEARRRASEIGDGALIACSIGTSALMDWVEHLAGVENAHLFLMSDTEEVEALFDVMRRFLVKKARLLAGSMIADAVYFVENTSTTLISPDQYRRYCLPHLMECVSILRGAGRRVILHMCGHLKAILPDLATLPVQAFEAFTSPPVGNTTLLDGRAACPNVCLIGGTNAALWRLPARRILAQIEKDLGALPHHRGLMVTSAGVMPPICEPETIKEVCDWVKTYPARWQGVARA